MALTANGFLNRAQRRALDKAGRCIDSTTKIPEGVRAQLSPVMLEGFAARRGKKFDGHGKVSVLTLKPETPAIVA